MCVEVVEVLQPVALSDKIAQFCKSTFIIDVLEYFLGLEAEQRTD